MVRPGPAARQAGVVGYRIDGAPVEIWRTDGAREQLFLRGDGPRALDATLAPAAGAGARITMQYRWDDAVRVLVDDQHLQRPLAADEAAALARLVAVLADFAVQGKYPVGPPGREAYVHCGSQCQRCWSRAAAAADDAPCWHCLACVAVAL